MAPLREPIDVQPFLDWCERREAQIRRELDNYPAITATTGRAGTAGALRGQQSQIRLAMELGWSAEHGPRRLHRWRNELADGTVERAIVEEALFHADADFEHVYPHLADRRAVRDAYCPACRSEVIVTDTACPWCDQHVSAQRPAGSQPRLGQGHRMTAREIRAAHIIYDRAGLSLNALADLIYERFGYRSSMSCASALRRGFLALGLPRRDTIEASIAAHTTHGMATRGQRKPMYKRTIALAQRGPCDATRKDGTPCPRAARPGQSTCGYHAPDEIARRRAAIARVNENGANTLRWQPQRSAA